MNTNRGIAPPVAEAWVALARDSGIGLRERTNGIELPAETDRLRVSRALFPERETARTAFSEPGRSPAPPPATSGESSTRSWAPESNGGRTARPFHVSRRSSWKELPGSRAPGPTASCSIPPTAILPWPAAAPRSSPSGAGTKRAGTGCGKSALPCSSPAIPGSPSSTGNTKATARKINELSCFYDRLRAPVQARGGGSASKKEVPRTRKG